MRYCLLLAGVCIASGADKADRADAMRVLSQRGLTANGNTWISREEWRLRRNLARLDKLERVFFPAREKFAALSRAYQTHRQLKEDADEARDRLSGQLSSGSLTPLARQQIGQRIKQIELRMKPIERTLRGDLNVDDQRSAITQAVLGLIDAQQAFGLALLAIRRDLKTSEEGYQALAQDDRVRQALEALPGNARLGPMENYRGKHLGRVDRLDEIVFGRSVPVYRSTEQFRISAIVGETAPATFGFTGSKGKLLLAASALQSAGIEVPEEAAGEVWRHKKREFVIRPVTLSHLRFGRVVLHDVRAWALPPEAEDIGCRISEESLAGSGPQLDEQRLTFRVRGR